jgi:hypothetical protein
VVHVFDLADNPQATRAYAWSSPIGNATRRENYIARARKRLEAGHPGKNDAAVVLAAGG